MHQSIQYSDVYFSEKVILQKLNFRFNGKYFQQFQLRFGSVDRNFLREIQNRRKNCFV